MRHPRLAIAVVASLIAFAGVGYRYLWAGTNATAAIAEPEPKTATVGALGRIEPQSEIVNLSAAPNEVLEDLSVSRGSTVRRGETIGHFRSYDEAAARERSVSKQLDEAKAQRVAETALGAARIKAAEVQLDGVLKVGPARINAQAATLRSIQIDLDNNKDILNGREELFRSNAGSRRVLADQEALVAHRQADLEAARARLTELTQQVAFDRATAEAAIAVERATMQRTLSQIPVESLERQLAFAHAQMITASLIAPIDGTVLNTLIRPGAVVGNGPILVLGDTSVMVAVAEVYETDVSRVRLGQHATVSAPALPKPLGGKVIEIGHMIYKNDVLDVDPAARTDARVVQVRVALDDGAAVADLTNLTVDVAIDVDARPNPASRLSAVR